MIYSRRALLALIATASAAGVAPTTAAAAPCDPVLTDGLAFTWDLRTDGQINDGVNDAFDVYGSFSISRPDNSASASYGAAALDSCGREDGDREVTYPDVPAIDGLTIARKVYVPSGDAFARFLDTVTNPTVDPVVVRVAFGGNSGSDGNTRVRASSSGDTLHDVADDWVVTDESLNGGPSDPTVSSVFDSTLPAPDGLDATTTDLYADADDNFTVLYEDVVVPASSSVTYMHLVAQRGIVDTEGAIDAATSLARGPVSVYGGLSEEERTRLQNFPQDGDGDGDGVLNRGDNCPTLVNTDQANLDGDASGDLCDADKDGDGLSDSAEAEFGTNPLAADSDADGKSDRLDGCPTKAGATADGCPVLTQTNTETNTVTLRESSDRLTPKSISSRVSRSGRTYVTSGVVTPPAGVSAAQGCGFGRVSVQVKAGSKTISNRRTQLRGDCSFSSKVVFRDNKRFSGKPSLKFHVRFLGNQRLQPITAKVAVAKVPRS